MIKVDAYLIIIKLEMNKSVNKRKAQRAIPEILTLPPNGHDKAIYEKSLVMACVQEGINEHAIANKTPSPKLVLRFMTHFDKSWEDVQVGDFTCANKMVQSLVNSMQRHR